MNLVSELAPLQHGSNGRYCSVRDDGGVSCDAEEVGESETFVAVPTRDSNWGGLKSAATGRYCAAGKKGESESRVECTWDSMGESAQFHIEPRGHAGFVMRGKTR